MLNWKDLSDSLAAFFMNLSLKVDHLEIPPRVSALLFIFFSQTNECQGSGLFCNELHLIFPEQEMSVLL